MLSEPFRLASRKRSAVDLVTRLFIVREFIFEIFLFIAIDK